MNEQASQNNPDYLQHHTNAETNEARAHEIADASKASVESAAMMGRLVADIEAGELSLTDAAGNSMHDKIRDMQAHDEQLATELEQEAGQEYDEKHAA